MSRMREFKLPCAATGVSCSRNRALAHKGLDLYVYLKKKKAQGRNSSRESIGLLVVPQDGIEPPHPAYKTGPLPLRIQGQIVGGATETRTQNPDYAERQISNLL